MRAPISLLVSIAGFAISGCGGSVVSDGSCMTYISCLQTAASGPSAGAVQYQSVLNQAIVAYGAGGSCDSSDSARKTCDEACKSGYVGVQQALGGTCMSATTMMTDMRATGGDNQALFGSSDVTMPANVSAYAYDLDGDGTADNRFGGILQAFKAIEIDTQASATASVESGSLLMLMKLSSSDPLQKNAAGATVDLSRGKLPSSAPKYDGTDVFQIDSATSTASFSGALTDGTFDSTSPPAMTTPVRFTLSLPLVANQPPLQLPVTAGQLSFDITNGHLTGTIHGGVKKTDVDSILLPAMAQLITATLQQPGSSPTLKTFDTDKNGTVTAAELQSNSLIAGLLSPDVQLFQGGVFKPNPAKTVKDSLSLGIAFQAATAAF